MRLTQWTDYTLRVLMCCAATQGREQPVTITEVAEGYGISRSHLMKIVQELAAQGLLETTRGSIVVTSVLEEVRVAGMASVLVTGENRRDRSYELSVESTGPDEVTARESAARTTPI